MRSVPPSSLSRLFAPRSIAVIGASPAPEKAGYQLLRVLGEFPGRIYPINPKAGEVLGFRAYPSLTAVGAPIDLAILTIPAPVCAAALREAAAAGCGAAVIVSGGFAEAGDAGARLQAELAQIVRESSIRLLGPNTSGFINAPGRVCASFAPGVEQLRAGHIGIVAQSGGVNLTLAFQLHQNGLGVSLAVGLGNMIDITAADALEYLANDRDTKAIALHLEGVTDGRRLYDVLRRVTPVKPVVALAVGRADVGEFAQSHTGNLIGSYARKVAALRQAGVVIVDTTDEVVDACAALSRGRISPKANPGFALVTGQAGPGLLIADRLRATGVALPPLSAEALARVTDLLPPITYLKNPIDTGRPSPAFPDVVTAVAEDPAIDAIAVFTLHEPAAVDPLTVLSGLSARTTKPLLFGTMGTPGNIGPTLAALAASGIPAFPSPERLALAARALIDDARGAWRLRAGQTTTAVRPIEDPIAGDLDEAAAKDLLARYGVRTPRRAVTRSAFGARDAFATLAKPIVAKILSIEITHKTEVGGVQLGIQSIGDLGIALSKLDQIPLVGERRYLLEEMAPPGVELIIGAVRDPSFGPTVMVGLGGVAAEALDDVAVRLAPLTEHEARDMLDELRGRALFAGWRGSPAVDRDAIARTIVACARLMLDQPTIAAIDLNPVRAYAEGVIALDALIIREK